MDFLFIVLLLLAGFTLLSAVAALFLKNLIHSALLLTVSWFGIAAFYLWADAPFVAFAQALVYVGAVSMVVLFAVLLTRHYTEKAAAPNAAAPAKPAFSLLGKTAAAAVAAVLCAAVATTQFPKATTPAPAFSVRQIGEQLIAHHIGVLLVTGVLLTVALLGAVIIAAPEKNDR